MRRIIILKVRVKTKNPVKESEPIQIINKSESSKTSLEYVKFLTTLILVAIAVFSIPIGIMFMATPFIIGKELCDSWQTVVAAILLVFLGILFGAFGIYTILAYKSIKEEQRETYLLSFLPSLVAFVALVISLVALFKK